MRVAGAGVGKDEGYGVGQCSRADGQPPSGVPAELGAGRWG